MKAAPATRNAVPNPLAAASICSRGSVYPKTPKADKYPSQGPPVGIGAATFCRLVAAGFRKTADGPRPDGRPSGARLGCIGSLLLPHFCTSLPAVLTPATA